MTAKCFGVKTSLSPLLRWTLWTGSKLAKVWPWNVEIRFGKGEFYGMSVEKTILSLVVVVVVVVVVIIIIIIIILYLPILLLELA